MTSVKSITPARYAHNFVFCSTSMSVIAAGWSFSCSLVYSACASNLRSCDIISKSPGRSFGAWTRLLPKVISCFNLHELELVVGLSFLELVKIQKDTKMMAKPKSQPIRRCLMVSQSASILLCLVMPCPGRFPPAKGGLNPPGPLGAGVLDAITGPPGTVRFKKRPSNGMLVLKASNDIG